MKKGWKKSGVIVGLMLLSAVVGSGSAAYGKSENILASLIKEAGAASDESSVFDTLSMQSVADVLKEEGYSAEKLSTDGEETVQWKMDGYSSYIIPYDEGLSIQFYICFSGTSATLEKVNEWNKTKRFSRSYLDDEGDPCLELDLDLAGGITRGRLVDYFKTCSVSFDQWHDEVASD